MSKVKEPMGYDMMILLFFVFVELLYTITGNPRSGDPSWYYHDHHFEYGIWAIEFLVLLIVIIRRRNKIINWIRDRV